MITVCGQANDACPVFPGKRYEDWDIADPAGQSTVEVRPIRDEVERRVLVLLAELGIPHATHTTHHEKDA